MSGQDFTMEPRDSWPKTEKTLRVIANAIGFTVMMLDIVVTEKIPEFVINKLEELNN